MYTYIRICFICAAVAEVLPVPVCVSKKEEEDMPYEEEDTCAAAAEVLPVPQHE